MSISLPVDGIEPRMASAPIDFDKKLAEHGLDLRADVVRDPAS